MRQLNTTVDVQDEKGNMEINFKYTDKIKEINFPFVGEIKDLTVENGECIVKQDINKILQCKPPSPFIVGTIKTTTRFNWKGLIEKRGNISFFSMDIPILWNTDEVYVTVKLPDKTLLAEKAILPISPSGYRIGSDGRRILATWYFRNLRPGDVIPIRLYYEPLSSGFISEDLVYVLIFLLILIVIVGALFISRKVSKKSELVLSVLNESERIVVDIIRNEKKKQVDQRRIVSLSGFSKAKISRIIRDLGERGIVESERIGRRNKIKLKKKFMKK
jgi:predicted transcriptional regulator